VGERAWDWGREKETAAQSGPSLHATMAKGIEDPPAPYPASHGEPPPPSSPQSRRKMRCEKTVLPLAGMQNHGVATARYCLIL
jgi:hypothetical protein